MNNERPNRGDLVSFIDHEGEHRHYGIVLEPGIGTSVVSQSGRWWYLDPGHDVKVVMRAADLIAISVHHLEGKL